MPRHPVIRIRATPVSLGGLILIGILLVTVVLAWIASRAPWHTPLQTAIFTFFFLLVIGYFADAWSELLELRNGVVLFDSLFRRKKRVNVCAMEDVLVVHEGLNQEHGIVSIRFRAADGTHTRLSLGPMWHRHKLEAFFRNLERATGECKLVEEVR